MITRFFARFIAGVSEELLADLFDAIMRELLLHRRKKNLSKVVGNLQSVLKELEQDESDVEKNAAAIAAGRDVINSLRK